MKETKMKNRIVRKGGKITINGKLVFDFRKETGYTVAGAADKVAKRLAKIFDIKDYREISNG